MKIGGAAAVLCVWSDCLWTAAARVMGESDAVVVGGGGGGGGGTGCSGGGNAGCLPPSGAKWDRWDMAGSTYQYCYPDVSSCPMDWLFNHSASLPAAFGGVTGVVNA